MVGGRRGLRVARTQQQWGRQRSFQAGLLVALLAALLCAYAAFSRNFWLLCAATVVAARRLSLLPSVLIGIVCVATLRAAGL